MELTRLAAHAAPFLLDVSLRSLIVFAAAGLACLVLRRASAAARHLLWSVTLVSLLCLPVLCALLPPLAAPVLPSSVRSRIAAPSAVQRLGGDADTAAPSSPPSLPSVDDSHNASSALSPSFPDQSAVTAKNDLAPQSPAPISFRPTPIPDVKVARHTSTPRLSGEEWLSLIWLTGIVAMLVRTVVGLAGAELLIRRCRPLTAAPAITAMKEAGLRLGVKVPISIREGTAAAHVVVPMTFGGLRPVVLLPAGAAEWPAERLQVVMMHETAHVGRRDWGTTILAQAVLALYWFHPLVWLTARRLRTEAETACDDVVLTHGFAAPDYAAHLLEVVRGLVGRRVPSTVVTIAYSHEIKARLRMILAERRNRGVVGRHRWLLVLITTVALLVPLAALRPVSSAPPQASGSGVARKPAPITAGAVASDDRVTAMMRGHSNWEKTLPNGIRVRLLAAVVSNTRGEVECSWTPDGTMTAPLNTQLVRTYGPGSCQFLCGIVFPSARLQNGATVSGGTAGRAQGYTAGVPLWHNGQAASAYIWPDSPNAWAGTWAGQGRGALELTIASGPTTPLIAAPPTQEATRRLPTGELLTLSRPVGHTWPALRRQVPTTEVTATLPSRFVRHLTDYDFEVIGKDGRPLRIQHAGTTEPDTSKEMTRISFNFRTSEAPLDRVKEVRLMYRPSQTAVFHNVALKPIRSSVQVPLPSSPSSPAPLPLTLPLTEAQKEQVASAANLRLIGRALTQYAADHDEHLPDAKGWMQQIIPYLVPATVTGAARQRRIAALFHDPASPPDQTWSYAYNRALSGLSLSKIDSPGQTVAVFESRQSVWNNSDDGQSIPQPGRHSGGNDYLFVDEHTKWLSTQSALPRFAPWEPSAHREIPIQGRIYIRRTRKPLRDTFVIFSRSPESITSGSVWPSSFTSKAGRFQSFVYPGRNYLMVLVNNRFTVIGRTLNFEADGNDGRLTTSETRIGPPGSPASDYTIHLSLPSAYALQMSSAPSTDHGMEIMSFVPVARPLSH